MVLAIKRNRFNMKRICDKLAIGIFIAGCFAYFFLASFNPILHSHFLFSEQHCKFHENHAGNISPEDEKSNGQHSDCPACKFLAKAYFGIISDGLSALRVDSRVVAKTAHFYQQSDYEIFCQCIFSRAPPSKSAAI